jgi:DNA-directed RNA polymerase subunit E'/Rpb7
MDIQRIYEKTLNLRPDEMYTKNLDDFILKKLREKYNNRCENSTFIKEIKSIVNKSMIKMAKDQLDGSGQINVQFLADAVVYEEGSVIVGCEIKKIEKTESIACEYGNLIIFIKPNY